MAKKNQKPFNSIRAVTITTLTVYTLCVIFICFSFIGAVIGSGYAMKNGDFKTLYMYTFSIAFLFYMLLSSSSTFVFLECVEKVYGSIRSGQSTSVTSSPLNSISVFNK